MVCGNAVVCGAGDCGVAGADRRSISRNGVGSGANGEVHEHLPAIGDDVFADPVAGSIDTRLLVEADRVGEEGFKVGVHLALGNKAFELVSSAENVFHDNRHPAQESTESFGNLFLADAPGHVGQGDIGERLNDIGVGLGAECWAGVALTLDERDDLVEVLADPVHGDTPLGDGSLEVILREVAHDFVAGCPVLNLDNGAEDSFHQSALVAGEDGEIGKFGGFVDVLALGPDGLEKVVEVLLGGVGLVVGEEVARSVAQKEFLDILAATGDFIHLVEKRDRLKDATGRAGDLGAEEFAECYLCGLLI